MMSQEQNNSIVKAGMVIGVAGTLCLPILLYGLLPKFSQEVILVDRIRLGLECLVFPAALFLFMIFRVGTQRFGNPSENPLKNIANTEGMQIDLRVLSNTHEQIVLFVINVLALSILLPYQYLSLLAIYSGFFVVGRMIFWMGYKHNVLWRAPGFAMSMLPAVIGLAYCCIVILQNIFANV